MAFKKKWGDTFCSATRFLRRKFNSPTMPVFINRNSLFLRLPASKRDAVNENCTPRVIKSKLNKTRGRLGRYSNKQKEADEKREGVPPPLVRRFIFSCLIAPRRNQQVFLSNHYTYGGITLLMPCLQGAIRFASLGCVATGLRLQVASVCSKRSSPAMSVPRCSRCPWRYVWHYNPYVPPSSIAFRADEFFVNAEIISAGIACFT